MKPWIYIFITTEKLNFAKMSVTTLLHYMTICAVVDLILANTTRELNGGVVLGSFLFGHSITTHEEDDGNYLNRNSTHQYAMTAFGMT